MKHWFHGRLEGHYKGNPSAPTGVGRGVRGDHFHFEIYRAIIRDIQLVATEKINDDLADEDEGEELASLPVRLDDHASNEDQMKPTATHHHKAKGPTLHQAQIAQVHLIDAFGPGRTLRGAAFDICASNLDFDHGARHDGKTYGRVEGIISGWFRQPTHLPFPEENAATEPQKVVWSSEVLQKDELLLTPRIHADSSQSRSSQQGTPAYPDEKQSGQSTRGPAYPTHPEHGEIGLFPKYDGNAYGEAESHPGMAYQSPAAALLPENAPELPFLAIGSAIAILLVIAATLPSAGIWCACFFPAWAMRKWLLGVIPFGSATTVASTLLSVSALLVAALSIAHWSTQGCKELGPISLLFLVAALFLSSLLPGRTPFAVCTTSLAAIIFSYYSSLGPAIC